MFEGILLTTFLMGFFGSVHCIAMCGGIVGILSQQESNSSKKNIGYILSYNLGRVISYAAIGLLAGIIGQLSFASIESATLMTFSRVFTSAFMLAFGFYLLGWRNFLTLLEKLGQRLWKHISPLTKRLLPIKSLTHSFLLGLIWGWLPCGLVYSALAISLTSASPYTGTLAMLSFGLGTLPMLLSMGLASQRLGALKQSTSIRIIAGSVIIIFATLHLFSVNIMGHDMKHGQANHSVDHSQVDHSAH